MAKVDEISAEVGQMSAEWDLCRSLLGGTAAMRKAGQKLLPKWPAEDQGDYDRRLAVSVLFPAYRRTVETLAAKPFSKPITIDDDVPDAIRPWLDDVDMEGRDLHAFCSDVFECAVGYGMSGILVEYPDARQVPTNSAGQRTLADERAAGLRPYFVEIKPWQLLGWRASRVRGQWVISQLRFTEMAVEPDGDFGNRSIEQIRVIEPAAWRIYRKADKTAEWLLFDEGVNTLGAVPFVPVYGRRTGFMMSEPPLKEVAYLNVAHWQSASDQQNILHVARVPILAASGVDTETFALSAGASTCVKLGAPEARLVYVEHSGAAIGAGADDLKDLEERMRQAGAELLVLAPGKVTASQVLTENAIGMCALQRMTLAFEDAIDYALDFMARWAGLGEDQGGHVQLFRDFGAATLAEASAQLLLDANLAGKLSDETLHAELQRRGIVAADVSFEAEQERLQTQGPAPGAMSDPGNDPSNDQGGARTDPVMA